MLRLVDATPIVAGCNVGGEREGGRLGCDEGRLTLEGGARAGGLAFACEALSRQGQQRSGR